MAHTKTASPLLNTAMDILAGGTSIPLLARFGFSSAKPALSNVANAALRKTPAGKKYLEKQLGDSFARGYKGKINAGGRSGHLVESAKNIMMSNSEAAHHLGAKFRQSFPEMEPSDMAFLHHLGNGHYDKARKVLDKYPSTKGKVKHLIGAEPDLSHPRVEGAAKDILDRLATKNKATRREVLGKVNTALPIPRGKKSLPRTAGHVASDFALNGVLSTSVRLHRQAYDSMPRVKELTDKAMGLLPKGAGNSRIVSTLMKSVSPSTYADYDNLLASLRKNNG